MRTTVLLVILLAALFGAAVLWSEVVSSPSLELAFFDVGQGDAIYFETPQGHQVLIDGGADEKVLSRLGEVMPFWDKTLDLVVLTHPEADHLVGLIAVFKRYEVSNVLWSGKEKDTKAFAAFKEALKEVGARILMAEAGQRILLGNSGAFLEILYPKNEIDAQKETSNESSVIMRLVFREHEALLTGDTVKKIEAYLVEAGTDITADILKVAHHGSNTSSSKGFLEMVAPEVAVISIGKDNSYGHPHPETLANLAEYGIDVRRTDQEETIFFYLK
ncbi:MAG: ComEC/Rec2 family competence protein [bacterium]|nr:ComEC/Rec2 family competence protein [bacterium]